MEEGKERKTTPEEISSSGHSGQPHYYIIILGQRPREGRKIQITVTANNLGFVP